MSVDTVVTGQVSPAGDGGGQARVAGWSVPGYTELKALGSGGFGDVVLARHDASGTLVAIKYLRPTLLSDPGFAEMFRAEAAMLAAMDDPHVVRLYEYIESPSGAAIVMELVDGVALRQILARQGATSPEAALVVLKGSLLGLAAAHRRGVVHRDYKPENVLVNGQGASKLTDFGLAARAGDSPRPAGTLRYAPPEQLTGGPASPAGDVYAATATFFECLAGRPPFTGDSAQRLLYQHLFEPVPVEQVPEPLRPLVAAGMAKQPGDRPADATTFVGALDTIAASTYGPDWENRGRSHLGEAALSLAALWPSGGPPAVQGLTVGRIPLRRRTWRRLRHVGTVRAVAVKAAIAAVAVATGAGLVVGLTRSGSSPSDPVITGVSPASGSTAGGTTVTITGTDLAYATAVRFGGVAGTITADSATQITVISPPSTGIVTITVTTRAGTSHPTTADTYAYTATIAAPQPMVTGVSPASGSTAGGTTVTITGTGLDGATAVRFGGVAGTITADSATRITVTSPPGAGAVTITVTTPAGTSTTTGAGRYAYTTQPEPIQSAAPQVQPATTVQPTTTAGKTAQSISFTAPASGTAGGSAVLSATGGGSGNPVVFSVDSSSGAGVCTVSGSTVTYAAAGSCVIDANQAGNASYDAAPQVQQTITVDGIPQSISFTAPASGTAGGSATLSATGGGSGNPVVFSVDSASGAGVCTVSGSTVTYAAAGSCVIDANQAGNASYAAAPQVQQTITVTSPAITASAAGGPLNNNQSIESSPVSCGFDPTDNGPVTFGTGLVGTAEPATSMSLPAGSSDYFYVGSDAGGNPLTGISWNPDLSVTAAYSGNEAISIGQSASDSASFSSGSTTNVAIAGLGVTGYQVTGTPVTASTSSGTSVSLNVTTGSGDLLLVVVGGEGVGLLQQGGASLSTLLNVTYSECGSDVIASAGMFAAFLPAGTSTVTISGTTYGTNAGASMGAVAYVLAPED